MGERARLSLRLVRSLLKVLKADRAQWLARLVLRQHAKLLYRALGLNQTPMAMAVLELLVAMAKLDTHTQSCLLNELDWSLPGWSKYATVRTKVSGGSHPRDQWLTLLWVISEHVSNLKLALRLPPFLSPLMGGVERDDQEAMRRLTMILRRAMQAQQWAVFTPALLLKLPALLTLQPEGSQLWRDLLPRLVQKGRLGAVCDLLALLQPLDNPEHEGLLRELLQEPRLFAAYWSRAPLGWEAEATPRYLALCTLVADTADAPICNGVVVEVAQAWPKGKLSRPLLTRACLHPNGLVQHAACLLLSRLLLRLERVVFEFERHEQELLPGGLLELAPMIPDWQTIVNLLASKFPTGHPSVALFEQIAASYARLWGHELPSPRPEAIAPYQAMLILQGKSVAGAGHPQIDGHPQVHMARLTKEGGGLSSAQIIQRVRGGNDFVPLTSMVCPALGHLVGSLLVSQQPSQTLPSHSLQLHGIVDESSWWSALLDQTTPAAICHLLLHNPFNKQADISSTEFIKTSGPEFIKRVSEYACPWSWLLLLQRLQETDPRRVIETGMVQIILQAAAHGHEVGRRCLFRLYQLIEEHRVRERKQLRALFESALFPAIDANVLGPALAWTVGEALRICLDPLHPIYLPLMEQLAGHWRIEGGCLPLRPQALLITSEHLQGPAWHRALTWTLTVLTDAVRLEGHRQVLRGHHWEESLQTLLLLPQLDPSIRTLVSQLLQ